MATGPIETHLHRSFNWENGAPGPQEGPRGRSANCGNGLSAQSVRLRSEINLLISLDLNTRSTPWLPAKAHGAPPKGAPQYRKLFSSLISQTYCVSFHSFYCSCHLTRQLRRYLRHSAIYSSSSRRFIHCAAKTPYRPRAPSFPQLRDALPFSHITQNRLHIPFKPHNKSSCAIFA